MNPVLRALQKIFTEPRGAAICALERLGFFFPDKLYLKLMYRLTIGEKLDLKNPRGFNAKLQWLKLYNRRPEYVQMVDKIEAKKYVADILGEEYIIPTLGVWDNPEDIDFDALPDKFVLKCNHNSGVGLYICTDKSKMDVDKIKKELHRGLKQNYFLPGREWPYKDVKRRVLAEQYLEKDQTGDLLDYKINCFNGKVHFTMVCSDRHSDKEVKFTFYDKEWKRLPFSSHHIPSEADFPKPENYDLMIELAECLAKDKPYVRIDFYNRNGKILFGEITFFHDSGFRKFEPKEWDYKIGDLIELPKEK